MLMVQNQGGLCIYTVRDLLKSNTVLHLFILYLVYLRVYRIHEMEIRVVLYTLFEIDFRIAPLYFFGRVQTI